MWYGSNAKEKLWVWDYNDKQAYMDIGEDVRGPPARPPLCAFLGTAPTALGTAMVDAGGPPSHPLHSLTYSLPSPTHSLTLLGGNIGAVSGGGAAVS